MREDSRAAMIRSYVTHVRAIYMTGWAQLTKKAL